jgi:hypothetical protein
MDTNLNHLQLAGIVAASFFLLIFLIILGKIMARRKWPYQAKNSILTPAELNFYKALYVCVAGRAVICPKVGLKDFIYVDKHAGKNYMKHFGKIAQKHVDFLLCDAHTYAPICGIELNDSTHLQKKVMERDAFVNKLYQVSGIPLITFTARSRYAQNELREQLDWLLD